MMKNSSGIKHNMAIWASKIITLILCIEIINFKKILQTFYLTLNFGSPKVIQDVYTHKKLYLHAYKIAYNLSLTSRVK